MQIQKATGLDAEMVARELMQGTRIGATPVSGELALPHLRHRDIEEPCMVLARIRGGLEIEFDQDATSRSSETVEAVFYLVSPDNDPALHLRLLAKLAGSVEEEGFMEEWMQADSPSEIRDILLRTDRSMSLELHHDSPGRLHRPCRAAWNCPAAASWRSSTADRRPSSPRRHRSRPWRCRDNPR